MLMLKLQLVEPRLQDKATAEMEVLETTTHILRRYYITSLNFTAPDDGQA
jgi:hypothetical protein